MFDGVLGIVIVGVLLDIIRVSACSLLFPLLLKQSFISFLTVVTSYSLEYNLHESSDLLFIKLLLSPAAT